jgi:tRNA A37 methylthiotransferase MiaB
MTASELVNIGWTQGAMARKADDTSCDALDKDAVKFSITGAIIRAYPGNFAEMYHKFYNANECLDFNSKLVVDYNDNPQTTASLAIEALRRAGM